MLLLDNAVVKWGSATQAWESRWLNFPSNRQHLVFIGILVED